MISGRGLLTWVETEPVLALQKTIKSKREIRCVETDWIQCLHAVALCRVV